MSERYVIGVDVGGTFTDVFFLDEAQGRIETAKVPSTVADQSVGFIEGIGVHASDFSSIASVVHGTTVGTNALLERKGAKTGLITTPGFADVLEMRRRDRPATWGLRGTFEPVIPRNLRLEVPERTLADGTIRTAVDLDAVRTAGRALLDAGCEAVCVAFINAYANPDNERRAVAALRELWPSPHVCGATEILPEIREFERTSTAALNAYLQPVVGRYLGRLERALAEGGSEGEVLIVQSSGGVMSVETARRLPVRTALSGPAAGVVAAAYIAQTAGFENVITCDLGGTSFDVAVVDRGESAIASQTSIDFGLVIRTPMVEITTIGAGGGSIARIDRGGLLAVGPESAGSDPGPVCYGRGGNEPTLTDANVVLGRINPDRPIGGKLERLDVDAARSAIAEQIGEPLGLNPERAAEAIVRVANAKMAGAIRLVSVERGHDPKRFVAMPFGGGGALHAGALIEDVGLAKALVPRYPGVTSALGCVISDMRHDFVETLGVALEALDLDELKTRMQTAEERGRAIVAQADVAFERIDACFELDMLYAGQTHAVAVPLPAEARRDLDRTMIDRAFDRAYEDAFGRPLEGIAKRVLNLRSTVIGRRPKFDLRLLAPASTLASEPTYETRQVYVDGGWHPARVYQRLELPVGFEVCGPAVLEQPDTTIFVEPGLVGRVDELGNLLLEPDQGNTDV